MPQEILEIETYDEFGHSIKHNIYNLKLPDDGRMAHKLDREELYAKLVEMGVDVEANAGKQALLLQLFAMGESSPRTAARRQQQAQSRRHYHQHQTLVTQNQGQDPCKRTKL